MGGRDRDTGRQYASGSAKRKATEVRAQKEAEVLSKTPKLTTFFNSQAKSTKENDTVISGDDLVDTPLEEEPSCANPINHEEETEDTEITSEALLEKLCMDTSLESVPLPVIGSSQISEPKKILPADQKPQAYSTDLGDWPEVTDNLFQEFWIYEGSHNCQNENADFSLSGKMFENENKKRFCKKSYFTKLHELTNTSNSRTWLCYSPRKGKLFCFPCKLLNSSPSKFTNEGFDNWKHASPEIRRHEETVSHKQAVLTVLIRRKKNLRVDCELVQQVESEKKYWQTLLRRIVEVIKFLAERGLAFRGTEEVFGSPHNGNYLGLLELLAKFDPFLEAHINKHANKGTGHVSYLSKSISEEFIEIIGDKMKTYIVDEIKKFKYYSISIDSTPDVSHVDQLTLIVRYVTSKGPVERFLTFLKMEGHTADQIAESLFEFLGAAGIDIKDCRGQSYDNASNMSGQYNGVQARVKNVSPYASFIPCFAHSLNLVGQCAADCCEEATKFFLFLESLYTFFSGSTFRWSILSNALKKDGTRLLTVKSLSATRWSARADATHAVSIGYEAIKEALNEISQNKFQKADCRQRARGLVSTMNKLETMIMIILWDQILQRFQLTSSSLQSGDQDLNTACGLYDSLYEFVKDLKPTFHDLELKAKEISGCDKYQDELRRQRKPNRKFINECGSLTVGALVEPQTATQKFKVKTFIPILDSLLSALYKRKTAYTILRSQFGFIRQLRLLSTDEIKSCATDFVKSYPCDVEPSLVDELIQFSYLLKSDFGKDLKFEDDLPELKMYKLLKESNLESCFPNVEVLLRIYLCLMVTNCSGERSFSKLGRVKNLQRSTMGQERLNSLMLMSVESELLREIDVSSIIDSFANAKCRKKVI